MHIYLPFILSFLFALMFSPFYIKFVRKMSFGQNILGYVKEHASKQGTPTMGGVIFILPTIITSIIFCNKSLSLVLVILSVFLSYAVVGFLDDFIKIKFKRNLGLHAYQKILFQLFIAIIIGIYTYKNGYSNLYLPFSTKSLDIGLLIIPFSILMYLATTNSVNLTDGLDGLSSGTSISFLAGFVLINSFYMSHANAIFGGLAINNISLALCGALLGFFMFNFYPAKIFMGDTGSLSLGGIISSLCLFSGTSLYLPILGIMFVWTSISVILQVLHFKRTHKRIFLMAPFHHHLQMKGMYETKITLIYIVITFVVSFTTIAILGGI